MNPPAGEAAPIEIEREVETGMQFYAEDIMSTNVITARPEMTCQEAAELFTLNKITGAPVVDSQGVLIGVITVFDLLQAGMNIPFTTDYFAQDILESRFDESGFHIEEIQGFLSDYMSRHVYTVEPKTPMEEVARLMYDNHIHRVIVIQSGEQRPVGMITTFDLLKLMAEGRSAAEFTEAPGTAPRRQPAVEKRGEPMAYRND